MFTKFDGLDQDGPSEIPNEDQAMYINRMDTPACYAIIIGPSTKQINSADLIR
jgi:hypothetical protein